VPPENPIISVKEARKLLGKEAAKLSDHEIMKLIDSMSRVAGHMLDKAIAGGVQDE